MKLFRYAFLVLAAFGALSFSVEASGMRVRIVDPVSYEYKREKAIQKEAKRYERDLEAKSPFLARPVSFVGETSVLLVDSNPAREGDLLLDLIKLIGLAEKVETKRQEVLSFLKGNLSAEQLAALSSMGNDPLNAMDAMVYNAGKRQLVPNKYQASRNWAKFLALDSAEASTDAKSRVDRILAHFNAIVPKWQTPDSSRDFEAKLIAQAPVQGFSKDFLVQSVLEEAGLPFAAPSLPPVEPNPLPAPPEASTSTADSSAQPPVGSSPEVEQGSQAGTAQSRKGKDAAPQTQAQKEDKKESKSIVPQVVRNNPLYFGLGSAAAVFVLWFAKIKVDYNNNPPVDESGEIIPFNKHVLSELASFDYTKMNFWLKTTALGLAGAGIYLKSTAAAAA